MRSCIGIELRQHCRAVCVPGPHSCHGAFTITHHLIMTWSFDCFQVLEKMKKEAQGFDPHIKALEEAVAAKATEKDAVMLAHREAQHSKEVAKQVGWWGGLW